MSCPLLLDNQVSSLLKSGSRCYHVLYVGACNIKQSDKCTASCTILLSYG